MSASSHLYRSAARVLAASILNAPYIQSICVRRSVASGEARFPFSDLDLDIGIDEDAGAQILALSKRLRLARILFPRTGQCFVIAPGELDELAATEPYRASVNRRCGIPIRGSMPPWPASPIPRLEAARRVVFWLDHYFPWAIRASHTRHQRKFFLEMANALGLLEGRWSEPHIRLRDVAAVHPIPASGLFGAALQMATAAHTLLGRSAPRVHEVILLPGLTILPSPQTTWPATTRGPVLTPPALDLLLQTQSPSLWLAHSGPLSRLGFQPPSPWAWARFARRSAGVLWLRGPGFFEPPNGQAQHRLRTAQLVLDALEAQTTPVATELPQPTPCRLSAYYKEHYPILASLASATRDRAIKMEQHNPSQDYTERVK